MLHFVLPSCHHFSLTRACLVLRNVYLLHSKSTNLVWTSSSSVCCLQIAFIVIIEAASIWVVKLSQITFNLNTSEENLLTILLCIWCHRNQIPPFFQPRLMLDHRRWKWQYKRSTPNSVSNFTLPQMHNWMNYHMFYQTIWNFKTIATNA